MTVCVCMCVFLLNLGICPQIGSLSNLERKKKNKRQRKTQSSQTTTNGRDMM